MTELGITFNIHIYKISKIYKKKYLTDIKVTKLGVTMKTENSRKQLGIRIPQELDRRLEKHVNRIGVSKQAFILNLIFNELEKTEKIYRASDDND